MAGNNHGDKTQEEPQAQEDLGQQQAARGLQRPCAPLGAGGEMSCADSVAKLLADAHFTSCFTKVFPSALECEEPIVVVEGAFSRELQLAEEERGSVAVTVLVVREVAADAESVAAAAELAVRRADWEPYADAGGYRIVGIDTAAPAFKERDSSVRYV